MAEYQGIYKCELCGNIVEVEHAGGGVLSCCGQEMTFMEEKTADSATEKHVPLVEVDGGKVKVTVGSTLHPMTEEHYIEWIEIIYGSKSQIMHLKPGDEPIATFDICPNCCDCGSDCKILAREYCNVHGHWSNK